MFSPLYDLFERLYGHTLRIADVAGGEMAAQVSKHFRNDGRRVGELRVLGDFMQAARAHHEPTAARLAVTHFRQDQTAVDFNRDYLFGFHRFGSKKSHSGAGDID